jgi:hypothetical protein
LRDPDAIDVHAERFAWLRVVHTPAPAQ